MPAARLPPVPPATLLLAGSVGWAGLPDPELLVVSFPSGPSPTAQRGLSSHHTQAVCTDRHGNCPLASAVLDWDS